MCEVMNGIVKWFSAAKGYGFIEPVSGGADVFVHQTAIVADGYRTLEADEQVSFEVVDGPKGPNAINVKRAQ